MKMMLEEQDLDLEWVELIQQAKNDGLTPQQVRIFLTEKREFIDVQEEY